MSKRKQNQMARDERRYVAKENKKFHIFAFILCLLIAFVIWLYASNHENEKEETNVNTNTQGAVVVRLPETL